MDKTRIIVADDHAVMRDGIRALVGHHDDIEMVDEASEWGEAVEKARELAPDVTVMDIDVPVMGGLEVIRRLIRKNPAAKILTLTQYDTREHIPSVINAGAAGYVLP